MLDYVRASGDVQLLKDNREAIEKAWAFETDPAHDTDHDGIYDNSQGTGWVESWPGGMPHQEIYLAELDQQASTAYSELENLLGNDPESQKAAGRAHDIAAKIEHEYYDPQKGCYAFATNPAGTPNSPVDRTTTVYPALAWWSGFNPQPLAHGAACLKQLAEHTLDTDWGLRDVSNEEKIYDGMSYHQGSVWPLFTGWAALAEFRGGQPLAGYRMLMQNASLTWAQDLGADTELLSGDFFVPFGRSTSHQLWSSAMVITPTLRGLFGISVDAQTKTITVDPHLPAEWHGTSEVERVRTPDGTFSLTFDPEDYGLRVIYREHGMAGWKLQTGVPGAHRAEHDARELILPVAPVDVEGPLDPNAPAPPPGSPTSRPRVLQEQQSKNSLTLMVEGQAGSTAMFAVTEKTAKTKVKLAVSQGLSNHAQAGEAGASLNDYSLADGVRSPPYRSILQIFFPPGEGWKIITVTLTW
jgi:hypothetical protein